MFAEIPPREPEGEREEVLCVGTEKGVVEIYSVEVAGDDEDDEDDDDDDDEEDDDEDGDASGPTAIVSLCGKCTGHTNRIKALSALAFPAPAGPTTLLTTVSSDGWINVYDLGSMPGTPETELKPVVGYDTKGSRLTTVSMAEGGVPRPPKKVVKAAGTANKTSGARFAEPEDDDEEESDEEEAGEDMYDQSGDESEEGSIEVELEGEEEEEEEEEEDEDEGEYE